MVPTKFVTAIKLMAVRDEIVESSQRIWIGSFLEITKIPLQTLRH